MRARNMSPNYYGGWRRMFLRMIIYRKSKIKENDKYKKKQQWMYIYKYINLFKSVTKRKIQCCRLILITISIKLRSPILDSIFRSVDRLEPPLGSIASLLRILNRASILWSLSYSDWCTTLGISSFLRIAQSPDQINLFSLPSTPCIIHCPLSIIPSDPINKCI